MSYQKGTSNISKLTIKNMVCDRCIKVVKEEIEKIGFKIHKISLGEVELHSQVDKPALDKIKKSLSENGFELIESKNARLIEKIKKTIIELVRNDLGNNPLNTSISKYMEQQIGKDYYYLSSLFSSVENITLEHYLILQKIERAKELLKYNEMTLSEIAYKLGYSSLQHLSNQFRKVTGMTATEFKKQTENFRKPIDKLHPQRSKTFKII